MVRHREKKEVSSINFKVKPISIRLLFILALRDLYCDRKVALCIISSLVAVVAPLLLLFGLKYGIVSHLRLNLLRDPRNLEIRILGNGNFDTQWLSELANQHKIGFAIPLTRSLNTQADLMKNSQSFVENAEIIPTALGDPLCAGHQVPQKINQLVLSASAATKLNVAIGDTLQIIISRKLAGEIEHGRLTMTVIDILQKNRFTRPAAFVQLDLLTAMEDFRDGAQLDLFGLSTGEPRQPRKYFAKARIYAKDIDSVAHIANWLNQQHIETVTRQAEIEAVKSTSYVLGIIFSIIAWVSSLGCIASLIGAYLANIDRKRKDKAVLRLLGFKSQAIILYIVIQALLLTLVAFGVSFLLYLCGENLLNEILGKHLPDKQFVCQLQLVHIVLAFVCTLIVAMVVSSIGAIKAVKIEPAESLREM